jgi:hypothetical protein
MAEDPAATPFAASATASPTPTEPPAAAPVAEAAQAFPTLGDVIAAIIRNGLSNGPIAQSSATWDHLITRLPQIVAAIMKEL